MNSVFITIDKPDHSSIIGNEDSDKFARGIARTPLNGPEPFSGTRK